MLVKHLLKSKEKYYRWIKIGDQNFLLSIEEYDSPCDELEKWESALKTKTLSKIKNDHPFL